MCLSLLSLTRNTVGRGLAPAAYSNISQRYPRRSHNIVYITTDLGWWSERAGGWQRVRKECESYGGSKPPPYDTEMEWSEFLVTTLGGVYRCGG